MRRPTSSRRIAVRPGARRLGRELLVLVAVVGCGREAPTEPPPPPPPADLPPPGATPPADDGDLVVATVDGQPVWASCVARRGADLGDRDAALAECVDAELLAQAAAARGIAASPETQRELRRILASVLVERAFEERVRSPADLPADVRQATLTAFGALDWPEMREANYVRVNVDGPGVTNGLPDGEARALAQAIYDALPGRTGLTMAHLVEATHAVADPVVGAAKIGGGAPTQPVSVSRDPFRTARDGNVDPAFAAALFALPEVGTVSPPTRTQWGWDLVYFSDHRPAQTWTAEEALASEFVRVRQEYFERWFRTEIARGHDVRVDVGPLEAAERLVTGAPTGEAP
ncbi:MAG: hypothetical protein R2939_11780 [Kofleriaceae bacterium]